MSYLALYRKYRPKKFDDVVGQEHIIRTLQNQIRMERIAHAYLFTGSRGTGKTTVAKIFARSVNCKNPINYSCCGDCEDFSMNVFEIDAASHNGVDSMRNINEDVRYCPTSGKYKVYIIDEVHMLSTGAFNAMLKTLEEPPAYVIFILATTDPQKIPATILSRCQRYDFRRITSNIIAECLQKYMQSEQVDIEPQALGYIARLANGGMRDALSILEQCISFYFDERITLDKVLYLVGAVDSSLLFNLMDVVREGDAGAAIAICDKVNLQGRSIRQFAKDLLVHCRNLLIAKTAVGVGLDYSAEYIEKINIQAASFEIPSLVRFINIFSQLDAQLRVSSIPKVILEVEILKLTTSSCDLSPYAFHDKIVALEAKLEQVQQTGIVPVEKKVVPKKLPEAVPDDLHKLKDSWNSILARTKGSISFFSAFQSTFPGVLEGDIFYIVHTKGMEPSINEHLEAFREIVCDVAQRQVRIVPILDTEYAFMRNDIMGTEHSDSREALSSADTLTQIRALVNFEITQR